MKLNRGKVISFFLAFVSLWFGVKEISSPEAWTAFVPSFLGTGKTLVYLVVFHGIALTLSGLAVLFNFHRRIAAGILALMILQIIVEFFSNSGLSETVVRDIGLFGMALALTMKD